MSCAEPVGAPGLTNPGQTDSRTLSVHQSSELTTQVCVLQMSSEFIDVSFLLSDLQHIEQDERVSMSLNGDLYFSHAVDKDSRRDYCCFAAFPRIRTIVQKTAMSVIVKTSEETLFAFFYCMFTPQSPS